MNLNGFLLVNNLKSNDMKKNLIVLFSALLFLSACGNGGKRRNNDPPTENPVNTTIKEPEIKPIVNVYIENSGSMDGYVQGGVTEFEDAIHNYLVDMKLSKITDSLNLFYINSEIIPQGSDVSAFIKDLTPASFKAKGGNRGSTDIADVFKSVLSETDQNGISIMVTDGIFSPGSGVAADPYLDLQQTEIKNTMGEYLELYPNTALLMYQLSSRFNGFYYNHEDKPTWINTQRPYYIWVIGDVKHINNLRNKVPDSKFKGGGVQNLFSITSGNKNIDYAVKMGSGNFGLDKKSPKNTLVNLKRDTKGKQNKVRFSINANLSGFLLSDSYLLDVSNYDPSNNNYTLAINKASSNNHGYTHSLDLSSDNVHKGRVSIKLKSHIPQWVEDINDDDGAEHVEGKTYGIKHQVHGIYEAFTFTDNYYTEIIINIK